jgi:hypothetical protein
VLNMHAHYFVPEAIVLSTRIGVRGADPQPGA